MMPALLLSGLGLGAFIAAPAPRPQVPETGRIVAFALDIDGNLAVEGWSARIRSRRGGTAAGAVRADPETGAFVFEDLAPARYVVQAHFDPAGRSGATAMSSLSSEVVVTGGQTTEAVLPLADDAHLDGRSSSGAAVDRGVTCVTPVIEDDGMSVPIDLRLFALARGDRRYRLLSDGHGHWYAEPWRRLGGPLVVRLDDARFEPAAVVVASGQARQLVLRGSGALDVIVQDADGAHATYDELQLVPATMPSSLLRSMRAEPMRRLRRSGAEATSFEGLVPGRYTLLVRSSGSPTTVVEDIAVPPGGRRRIEATLAPWHTLRVQLLPPRSTVSPVRIELTPGAAPGRARRQVLSVPASVSGRRTSDWLVVPETVASVEATPGSVVEIPFLAPGRYLARVAASPWCVDHRVIDLADLATHATWPAPVAHRLDIRVQLPADRSPTDFGVLPNYWLLARRLVAELADEASEDLVVGASELWRLAVENARPSAFDSDGHASVEGLPPGPIVLDLVEVSTGRRLFRLGSPEVDGESSVAFDLSETMPRNVVVAIDVDAATAFTMSELTLYSLADADAPPVRDFVHEGRAVLHSVRPGPYLATFRAGAGFGTEPVQVSALDEPLTLRAELRPGRLAVSRADGRAIDSSSLVLERLLDDSTWRVPSRNLPYSGPAMDVRMPPGRYALTDPKDRARGEFTWRAESNGLVTVRLDASTDSR